MAATTKPAPSGTTGTRPSTESDRRGSTRPGRTRLDDRSPSATCPEARRASNALGALISERQVLPRWSTAGMAHSIALCALEVLADDVHVGVGGLGPPG
jgi:hypothetical protein